MRANFLQIQSVKALYDLNWALYFSFIPFGENLPISAQFIFMRSYPDIHGYHSPCEFYGLTGETSEILTPVEQKYLLTKSCSD